MKALRGIALIIIALAFIVTCDNVQVIREATTTEQSIYEKAIRNIINKGEESL